MEQPGNIAHYRLGERLGAGGMGVVYKADDTKLERAVAIKLLHASALTDADRLQRFVQEAKTTSALNHPNIATIHQLGEHEGRHYIVMEWVQGDTLRDRLRPGALEMRDVVDLGVQVAEGLAAAHEAGVVHRDLKPENLMLRPDRLVKILDFGLAKLIQAPGQKAFGAAEGSTGDDTIVQTPGWASSSGGSQPTVPGMVMGTVGYMAPEQVRGDAVDARADVFALGCVLYEATTAQRAFGTASAIEVMHAILKEHPRPLHEARPDAPVELERIVRKALAKSPNERYQSAKDLAIDLRNLRREIDSGTVSATYAVPSGAQPVPSWTSGVHAAGGALSTPAIPAVSLPQATPHAPRRSHRRTLLAILPLLIAAGATVALFLKDRRREPAPPAAAMQITRLTSTGKADWPVVSPDGKYAAYTETTAGKTGVTLRQIATSSTVQLLEPVDDAIGGLAFSPDGDWLYYLRVPRQALLSTLYRVPVLGGTPQRMYEDVDSPPALSPDSKQLAFMRHTPPLASDIYVAAADGSDTPRIVVGHGTIYYTAPQWSPDGRSLALVARDTKDFIRAWITLAPAAGGEPQRIPGEWAQVMQYCWAADGKTLYISGMRQSQALTLQLFRQPASGGTPRQLTSDLNNYAGVSVSADGKKLVSLRSFTQGNFWSIPAGPDAASNTQQAVQIENGTSRADNPSPSPDGRSFVYVSDAGNSMHLWIMNTDGTNARQVTSGPQTDLFPAWSPDGGHIAYTRLTADSVRVWVMKADGSGARQLSFGEQSSFPSWSPDSRWIAYHVSKSDKSLAWKVPVEGGAPVQISDSMSAFPVWSPDGSRLLCVAFNGNDPVVSVLSAAGGVAKPTTVPFRGATMNFAWNHDGTRIVGVKRANGASNLALYPLDGGEPELLTQFPAGPQILSFALRRDGTGFIVQRGTTTRDAVLLENF